MKNVSFIVLTFTSLIMSNLYIFLYVFFFCEQCPLHIFVGLFAFLLCIYKKSLHSVVEKSLSLSKPPFSHQENDNNVNDNR